MRLTRRDVASRPAPAARAVRAAAAAAIATFALAFAGPRLAGAAEYELFISVATEDELTELFLEQQISEETFEILRELLGRGVDLNQATRQELYTLPNLTYADVDAILAYRAEAGRIADPLALVASGVLSHEKLLAIAPFLVVRDPDASPLAASGRLRVESRWSAADDRAPATGLQARAWALDHLELGVAATLTRNQIGDVAYDPNRDALSATPQATRAVAPRLYALWDAGDLTAIAGTYRIGFGQRLTFDNTRHYTPSGIYPDAELLRDDDLTRRCKESTGELGASPCAGPAGAVFVTPDYRWSESLLGVAVGVKRIELGAGALSVHGFGSYAPRGVYQYEIYDRGACADPRADGDPACAAPDVFRRQDDPLAPTSELSFLSLPGVYDELVGGANVTYRASRRVHVGVTGYGAAIRWRVEGMDLDFQEFARRPFGGPFGAVGVDAAWGRGWLDVFAEVAHSFDSTPGGGGGPAAIVRATATDRARELEASLRYYDDAFANPYARPIAAPDELDGLRARDEVGARLKYTGVHRRRVNLRANADLWAQPSDGAVDLLTYARADVDASDRVRWGLWAQYQNKDLSRRIARPDGGVEGEMEELASRGACFEVSIEDDERGEPIPCAGEKVQLTGRLRWAPRRWLSLTGQLRHEWVDDAAFADDGDGDRSDDARFRQDFSAYLIAAAAPHEAVRVRARTRYLFEGITDNTRLEQSWWTYVDVSYRAGRRHQVRARYDLFVWLDERASTLIREPSPEHWLRLEYTGQF